MRTIQVRGKTEADGVLHLSTPLETPHGEFEVVIVVEPQQVAVHPNWPPGFFQKTAGGWQGELDAHRKETTRGGWV